VPRVEMPSMAQVRELPELMRHTVPPSWEDMNGHVNVQHYTALYDMAGYPFMDLMGITAAQVRDDRIGLFDLEHHVWFLDEMHVGDVVTGHACLVERGPKRVLSVMFIVDETRGRLASALEVVSSTAHLDTRRTVALPPSWAMRIDGLIAEQRARGWMPPRSGALSV
jgi:acyl-CoA thioester hydrolase